MILVDASVRIDPVRNGDAGLADPLGTGRVLAHSFVTGDSPSSTFGRTGPCSRPRNPPQGTMASDGEVLVFIEREQLNGMGIGHADAHLLAASFTAGAPIWTRDRRLRQATAQLGLSANLS